MKFVRKFYLSAIITLTAKERTDICQIEAKVGGPNDFEEKLQHAPDITFYFAYCTYRSSWISMNLK